MRFFEVLSLFVLAASRLAAAEESSGMAAVSFSQGIL
jgi:hypothetical protein